MENGDHWVEVIEAVCKGAGLDDITKLTFMIDKSSIEISAVEMLGATCLLCIFHMLQDWEFLKSAKSGVHGKANFDVRQGILMELRILQRASDKGFFDSMADKLI